MILLTLLAYFVIACFTTVCAEKIFKLQECEDGDDNAVQYLIGMFWFISVPFIFFTFGLYYLGKFLCKNFRRLLNVNQC